MSAWRQLLGFPSLGAREPRLQAGSALSQASHRHPGPGVFSPLVLLLSQDGLTTNNLEAEIIKKEMKIIL